MKVPAYRQSCFQRAVNTEELENFRLVGSPCPGSSFFCGCQSIRPRTNQTALEFSVCPGCERLLSADVACRLMMASHPVSFLPPLFFSSPLPAGACSGLETLEEGEVSSVALEGNPAWTQPTKIHSARPAGASDPLPPQVS